MNYKKQNIYGHLDLLGVVWGTSWGVWGSIWAPCWLHVGSMLPPCWLLVVPHLGHLGPGSPRAPKSEKKIKFHASRATIRKNSIGKKYGTRTWVCAPPKRECIFFKKKKAIMTVKKHGLRTSMFKTLKGCALFFQNKQTAWE